jgi:hypothetical protein
MGAGRYTSLKYISLFQDLSETELDSFGSRGQAALSAGPVDFR